MPPELRELLSGALLKQLLTDLLDATHARTLEAYKLIAEHTDLRGRRARGLEGQARFRLLEKSFEDTCNAHGGVAIPDGVLPGTDLRFYQPLFRFGGDGPGIVLGLASMPGAGELPQKNKSRLSGVSLNGHLIPQLLLDESVPREGDIFALFLFARDKGRAGHVEEVAIGIIDGGYNAYVAYEPIHRFLAGYAPPEPEGSSGEPLVRLKEKPAAYKPPEITDPDSTSDDKVAE